MNPNEFDDFLAKALCSACGAPHERTCKDGLSYYQGAVLTQMIPGTVNGLPAVVMEHVTLCTGCLDLLQAIADIHVQDEDQCRDPADLADLIRRKREGRDEENV